MLLQTGLKFLIKRTVDLVIIQVVSHTLQMLIIFSLAIMKVRFTEYQMLQWLIIKTLQTLEAQIVYCYNSINHL